MVLSFFVSNIITVLGSMMDSFTVSNTMDEAAVGFVSPDSETFGSCVAYLRGTVIGVPAITVMSIFTRGAHIEGNRNLMLLSAAVMVKAELINIGISEFNAEAVGLQAYNVTVQVNYFVNALMMSAVSAMFLLAGISAGNIIAVLILPVFVAVINKMGTGRGRGILGESVAVLHGQGRVCEDRVSDVAGGCYWRAVRFQAGVIVIINNILP